jgi:hypothetical protein
MRARLLIAAVAACALAAPATAPAAVQVGIAENQPAMFTDPLFTGLGVKRVRLVTAWNVMTSRDDELGRVTQYLDQAGAAGIEPLVTFEHARGDASRCGTRRNQRRRRPCKLPTVAQYERNVKLFLARFPQVKLIVPWNEINHFTQPTSRDPRRAAQFTDSVRKLCATCTVVVADLLDQPNSNHAGRLSYTKTVAYIRAFRRALQAPRGICGIHNYSDVNRFRDRGTKAIIGALGCTQYWFTETGGLYRFGTSFPASAKRQAKAVRFMFKLAARTRHVRRVYLYNWFGLQTPRFDAGIVAKHKPRAAYKVVKRHL